MITHDNLADNLRLIVTGLEAADDTVVVGWLPQASRPADLAVGLLVSLVTGRSVRRSVRRSVGRSVHGLVGVHRERNVSCLGRMHKTSPARLTWWCLGGSASFFFSFSVEGVYKAAPGRFVHFTAVAVTSLGP